MAGGQTTYTGPVDARAFSHPAANLDADALASHVAWDPGAYDVALLLSELLDATLGIEH